MGTILLNLLSFVVKRIIDAKLFVHIQNLVLSQINNDLTGDQKKQAVKDELASLQGDLKASFQGTSNNLVNFAIEAALILVKK
jgi:hypothetical protein